MRQSVFAFWLYAAGICLLSAGCGGPDSSAEGSSLSLPPGDVEPPPAMPMAMIQPSVDLSASFEPLPPELVAATSFADVAGAEDAKAALESFIDVVNAPGAYKHLGLRPARGILMVGPPGTGKTMLARATAQAAKLPIFVVAGSDLLQYGSLVSPTDYIRGLFAAARRRSPAIVFIDEIDAIRGNEPLAKLLGSEMDGFVGAGAVYVLAAANSTDYLPASLLRAGRFDRVINVQLPNAAARAQILRRVTQNTAQAEDVDLDHIASLATSLSGAALVDLANVAALHASTERRNAVTAADWENALLDVTVGRVNSHYKPSERAIWRTAVHETGHALGAILLGSRVHHATILARGSSAGHTSFLPSPEELDDWSAETLATQVAIALAGQVAEEVLLRTVTPGCEDDLEKATTIARSMVARFGMGESLKGISLSPLLSPALAPMVSERLHAQADAEIASIVKEQRERMVTLFRKNELSLFGIARELSEAETLTGAQIKAMHELVAKGGVTP